MKLGAFDYIAKPFTPEQIDLVIRKAEQVLALENRISVLREDLKGLHPEAVFASKNPKMQRLIEMARQVAASEAAVRCAVRAEPARRCWRARSHGWSSRADFPFGTVSCPDTDAGAAFERAFRACARFVHRGCARQSGADRRVRPRHAVSR